MPLNIPTFVENNISFGPGRVFIGAAGATPLEDVGAITEDGVQIEITSEKKTITQGNPKLPIYVFSQAQGAMVKLTGIEWKQTLMAKILGAGQTTTGGGQDTFAFGGDPLVTKLAIRVEHQMAITGNTLYGNIWTAVGDGGLAMSLDADEHKFPSNYMALRSTTNWAGETLDYRSQLIQIVRVTA